MQMQTITKQKHEKNVEVVGPSGFLTVFDPAQQEFMKLRSIYTSSGCKAEFS